MSTERQKITSIRRFFRVPFPSPLPSSALILPTTTIPPSTRTRVALTEPSSALMEALKKDPSRDVFYLERTGELFETYEYALPPVSAHSFHSKSTCIPRNI